jgi:hypothetical protein
MRPQRRQFDPWTLVPLIVTIWALVTVCTQFGGNPA